MQGSNTNLDGHNHPFWRAWHMFLDEASNYPFSPKKGRRPLTSLNRWFRSVGSIMETNDLNGRQKTVDPPATLEFHSIELLPVMVQKLVKETNEISAWPEGELQYWRRNRQNHKDYHKDEELADPFWPRGVGFYGCQFDDNGRIPPNIPQEENYDSTLQYLQRYFQQNPRLQSLVWSDDPNGNRLLTPNTCAKLLDCSRLARHTPMAIRLTRPRHENQKLANLTLLHLRLEGAVCGEAARRFWESMIMESNENDKNTNDHGETRQDSHKVAAAATTDAAANSSTAGLKYFTCWQCAMDHAFCQGLAQGMQVFALAGSSRIYGNTATQRLTALDLVSCRITDEMLQTLASGLMASTNDDKSFCVTASLHLGDNLLTSASLETLASLVLMMGNSNQTTANKDNNNKRDEQQGHDEQQQGRQTTTNNHYHLEKISLANNPNLFWNSKRNDPKGNTLYQKRLGTFCRALQNSQSVRVLHLKECGVTNDVATSLLTALQAHDDDNNNNNKHTSSSLCELDLNGNGLLDITGEWVECLGGLASLRRLVVPSLGSVGQDLERRFLNQVKQNTSLTCLQEGDVVGMDDGARQRQRDMKAAFERNVLIHQCWKLLQQKKRQQQQQPAASFVNSNLSVWPMVLDYFLSKPNHASAVFCFVTNSCQEWVGWEQSHDKKKRKAISAQDSKLAPTY